MQQCKSHVAIGIAFTLLLALPAMLPAQSPIPNPPVSWEEMMLNPAYDFYQIQQAFNAEWDGKPYQSGNGYKQFKRWEYLRATTVESNGIYDNLRIRQEFQKFLAHDFNRGTGNKINVTTCDTPNEGGDWSALGPFNEPNTNNGIGRVNVVAFHPTNASIIWVGTPAGGLWKSVNGGTAWTTGTDDFTNLGVSDIAIHPTNPDIMYLGTGDRDHSDTYAFGLLKSIDGGVSWTLTSLPVSSFNLIHRVLINPSNPDILLVATGSGLWRSINAGVNWTQINSTYFRHMEFKPGDPNIVYAGSYASSQFYRSTNGGASFSLVTLPAPSSGTTVQRFAIAVTPASDSTVYLLGSYNDPTGGNDFNGLYKSTNSGVTFTQVLTITAPDLGSQSWYDWTLAVSPTNANEIYAGGVGFYKTTDGGITWVAENSGGGVSVHVDHHFAGYQPVTNTLFVGSDGGVFKTADGGVNWVDLSDGLVITQYYRLGSSALNAGLVLTGSQDNGTHRLNAGVWDHVFGGDGMECLIDHTNDNIQFASYQNGFVMKSTNGGNGFGIDAINPDITGESGAWVTPYVMDPNDHNVLYAGYKSIWKSTNLGTVWTNVSGVLTTSQIEHIAIAPSNSQVIYATDYYQMWKSVNGGTSWAAVTDPGTAVRSIAVHDTDPGILWIAIGTEILKSVNGGTSWTNVSGTLPNIPMRTIVLQPNANNALYVGSEIGIYYTNDLLGDWELFSDNLPNVIIEELQIMELTGKIRAASFGRGLWESDLYCTDDPVCSSVVTELPYEEGFETGFGLWQQSPDDDFDWTQQTGPTPSPNTGPAAAAEGSYYVFVEATDNTDNFADLISPCLNLTAALNPVLQFRYHLFGADIGLVSLSASTDFGNNWASLWSLSGNQGDSWQLASVPLSAYAGQIVMLRFHAEIIGEAGDAAIDDIYLDDFIANPSACGLGRAFPDNSCTTDNRFAVNVSAPPGALLGVNSLLTNAKIIVEHTWDADLDIILYSPNGASAVLSTDNGGSGDNFGNPADVTCTQVTDFSMSAATLITAGTAPFIGSYRPEGNFASFHDGSSPAGVWILELCDDEAQDAGTLEFVELVFLNPPSCTSLSSPANAATNVAVTTSLTWAAATGTPAGYRLNVGTTPGGTDILNNFDAGNVLTYDPPGYFAYGATIYVTVKPYNATGSASGGCTEQSFATGNCIANLTIVSIPVGVGMHKSLGELLSHTSTVANGTAVTFTSDTGVLLNGEFVVEAGGVFEVNIVGCSTPGAKPEGGGNKD